MYATGHSLWQANSRKKKREDLDLFSPLPNAPFPNFSSPHALLIILLCPLVLCPPLFILFQNYSIFAIPVFFWFFDMSWFSCYNSAMSSGPQGLSRGLHKVYYCIFKNVPNIYCNVINFKPQQGAWVKSEGILNSFDHNKSSLEPLRPLGPEKDWQR